MLLSEQVGVPISAGRSVGIDARVKGGTIEADGAYGVTVTQELVELLTRVQLPLGTQNQNAPALRRGVLVPAVTTGVE